MAEQQQQLLLDDLKWYTRLREDIRDMVEREKEEVLRIHHEMGTRILTARKECGWGEKEWSARLGDLLMKLADDVGYQVAGFYDALKLVQKAPTFNQLRKMTVPVKVTGPDGKESEMRVPVMKLGWEDVKRNVLYPAPPAGPAPIQSQRAEIACVFKSESCHGDTKQVEICGYHFGDFVVWQNQRKLKPRSTR